MLLFSRKPRRLPEAIEEESRDAIEEDAVVWIRGNVSENRRRNGGGDDEIEEDTHQIQAEEHSSAAILPIDAVVERYTSAVEVTISESDAANQEKLDTLRDICVRANLGRSRSYPTPA